MERTLPSLVDRLDQLNGPFRELRDGVRKAIQIAEIDPDMALTRLRKVLEQVVRDVFERRVKEPPGTRPLENLLQRLVKEGCFSERLDAYANTVRKLGNVGTHNFGERITSEDVFQSLNHLTPILEWYLVEERPDAGLTRDGGQESPEASRLRQSEPGPSPMDPAATVPSSKVHAPGALVPKGLRPFDASDSDSFLQLLPGPRGRDGLPQSIRFWKQRIETIDELTFTVGVIYGPSGCGKSSLVKAGLLPRLSSTIVPMYVEATADGTETRVLNVLRKRLPDLPAGLDLPQTVARLRQGEGLRPHQKALLVIDQFEQWLHARRKESETELAQALRQCDGEHVQCIVMVRDDFWIALSRFMESLEIALLIGENAALVDLFDRIHARSVLMKLGRAFGRLPEAEGPLSKDQEAFLDQVIDGLAQDQRVISIRLSLFAEMTKGRPWTPATLKEVGGTEGVGVTFLEETFHSTALRHHQEAAQLVLKALLPETGLNIKGHMRSDEKLLEASGYAERPKDFSDLVRLLDREFRLITPTDPEGVTGDERPAGGHSARAGDGVRTTRHYQLTHDYLIAPLREWLTRKKRESWRGRMELMLEERTNEWRRGHDRRFLPSWLEYLAIMTSGRGRHRTAQQRALIGAATRYYGIIAGLLALLAAGLVWGVWEANGRIQGSRLVQAIYAATPSELPRLIDEDLPSYRRWANPLLRRLADDPATGKTERLHAALALAPVDDSEVTFLAERLVDSPADELALIRKSLEPSRPSLVPVLWARLHDPRQLEQARFNAGVALAAYAPDSPDWTRADLEFLVGQLLSSHPDNQALLRSYLSPMARRLIEPLHATYQDGAMRESIRLAAAAALEDYGREQPELLAELASEATPEQYALLFPALAAAERNRVTNVLTRIVRERPTESLHEAGRVRLGRKRAGAAISLWRLGQGEVAKQVFRVEDDPESLTQFVHGLKQRHLEGELLATQLEQAFEERVRFGLILSLGEFSRDDLSPESHKRLVEKLIDSYRNDPSSAIHAASGWLLRKWGLESETAKVDRTALPYDPSGVRQWFVVEVGRDSGSDSGRDYFTFVVFRPAEFQMGSLVHEAFRDNDETSHRVRLTRSFAVCDRELTESQWRRFEKLGTGPTRETTASRGERPAAGLNWPKTIAYCRWLTERAGRSEAEQCFETPRVELTAGLSRSGPGDQTGAPRTTWEFHLDRRGFRLPTESEWEFAARAATVTTFSFGSDAAVLDHYAWRLDDSARTLHEVATLRPNLRGLFDVHGNAWEWCCDFYDEYPSGKVTDPVGPLSQRPSHVARGGGWGPPLYCRSAYRSGLPQARGAALGLRLACTLPAE